MKKQLETVTRSQRRAIAQSLQGKRKHIAIGRSRQSSGFGTTTPIQVIPGDSEPVLIGQPFLKTNFVKGGFSKTLYTPSTLRVEVGEGWLAKH